MGKEGEEGGEGVCASKEGRPCCDRWLGRSKVVSFPVWSVCSKGGSERVRGGLCGERGPYIIHKTCVHHQNNRRRAKETFARKKRHKLLGVHLSIPFIYQTLMQIRLTKDDDDNPNIYIYIYITTQSPLQGNRIRAHTHSLHTQAHKEKTINSYYRLEQPWI